MKDYKSSVKFTLIITYLLMLALVVFIVALPFVTTWYVEKMGRPADLAIVTMLSCYPCVPFAAVSLISLSKLLKNILRGDILDNKNLVLLKRIGFSCLFAGCIMIIAGFFYKPFFISGASAIFCTVIIKVIFDILDYLIEKKD